MLSYQQKSSIPIPFRQASRHLLSSPSLRGALLSLVADRCGAATAEAVLLAERGQMRQRLPWPRWQVPRAGMGWGGDG